MPDGAVAPAANAPAAFSNDKVHWIGTPKAPFGRGPGALRQPV